MCIHINVYLTGGVKVIKHSNPEAVEFPSPLENWAVS